MAVENKASTAPEGAERQYVLAWTMDKAAAIGSAREIVQGGGKASLVALVTQGAFGAEDWAELSRLGIPVLAVASIFGAERSAGPALMAAIGEAEDQQAGGFGDGAWEYPVSTAEEPPPLCDIPQMTMEERAELMRAIHSGGDGPM